MPRIPKRTKSAKPRAKRASDELYNIRRRYRRAAERYERKAEKLGDTDEARQYIAAAAANRRIAESLRADVVRGSAARGSKQSAERISATIRRYGQSSIRQTSTYQRTQSRAFGDDLTAVQRSEMARSILSGSTADVFYASTRDLWQEAEGDRNNAIVAAFQRAGYDVSDVLDVLSVYQNETGINFFGDEGTPIDKSQYKELTRIGTLHVSTLENA